MDNPHVRTKFTVESKTETKDGYKIVLRAVTATNDHNKKFFKYTPSGTIEVALVAEATAKQFTPGKDYYVDFKAVENGS